LRALLSTSSLTIAIALAAVPLGSGHAQVGPAQAQADPSPVESGSAPEDTANDDDTIVVLAARMIGQVDAPQPPLLELAPEDIAAYGAGSIAELLQSLGPQVSSGRGRGGEGGPIVLVNGVRIASFRELGSYPPEAIDKIEVFTEEVAQRYGYSPDQRVVNVILKPSFSSREVELEYGQPWAGGYSTQEAELTYLRIAGQDRLNINLGINNSSLLTEAERGVEQTISTVPPVAGDPDPADYRSLVSDSASLEATINWATRLDSSGTGLSLNASFEREDTLRLQGLDSVTLTDPGGTQVLRTFNEADPLTVDRRGETYSAGGALNFGLGDWQLTGTIDASRNDSTSITQRRANTAELQAAAAAGTLALNADLDGLVTDGGFDRADTTSGRATSVVTARGNPIYLPSGEVSVTLDAGFDWNRIQSEDTRNAGAPIDLRRGIANGGINVGVPLTSRDEEFLSVVGDISLNASAGVEHLSDFGTLYDWSVGLTWGLTERLTVTGNYINRDAAPSLSQLGNPEIATFNVPVFDLNNNETVLATVVTGGNPNLLTQSQSDWKFGLIWQIPVLDNATFSFDYIKNHSDNVAAGLPTVTPEIEAAFPGRVLRDGTGRITSIDQRPVNFAEQDVERLQFGLNLSGQIGSAPAQSGGNGRGGFGAAAGAAGGAPGGPQFSPERFAEMRAQFCDADPAVLLRLMNETLAAAAAGEAPPVGEDGQPLAIPAQMLERLKGEDGTIDPARFEEMRTRICNAPAPGAPGAPGAVAAAPGPGGLRGIIGGAGGPPGGFRGPGAGGGPGGGGFRPGGMGGPPGGGQGSAGRWFVNLQYTHELENTLLIAQGLPLLDLLDGDALSGGGQPRHSVSARAGLFYKGFGLISFANYTGSSRLEGSGTGNSTDLEFGDYATFNLRAFVDLGQQASLIESVPFFDKTRIGIGVDNVFDARQRVTDDTGEVPLRYQPFLIDPIGRSVEIEFRKLF